MALDVPRPELDDVAVGIGDVQGATAIVVGERNDFGHASLVSQSLDRGIEAFAPEVEGDRAVREEFEAESFAFVLVHGVGA